MRIYLIRHGRQSSRLCNVDVDLSPEGFRQAALLGERLFKTNIQAVYSSDLIRAVQTAQAANLYWNVEHTVLPELREISFGELTGLSDDAIRLRFADFKERESRMEEDIPYPGGECAGDVVAFRWLRPVFRYGVALASALTLGQLLYEILWRMPFQTGAYAQMLPMGVCMVIAAILGYYIASMLLKKSLRVDMPVRYPPYKKKLKWLKKLSK